MRKSRWPRDIGIATGNAQVAQGQSGGEVCCIGSGVGYVAAGMRKSRWHRDREGEE